MEKNARATKKQRELLAFIDTFIKGNNYGPSYREIMRGLGYKSVSTVAVHVDGLIAAGFLRKRDNSARSIEVLGFGTQNEKPSEHEIWLKDTVSKRLKQETVTEEQAHILRQAMDILGVELSDTTQ
ncbi:hypothetical protein HY312_01745 [Candidatus Saccharibacteria bacterium]|nr:hypothetical protein [Candidatus Saccharibacteria bacterium]